MVHFSKVSSALEKMSDKKQSPMIIVHGGAGVWNFPPTSDVQEEDAIIGVIKAAIQGWVKLEGSNGNAVDAVHDAIIALENDEIFNAGRGTYLTQDGKVEMEAFIQDGISLRCGIVAKLTNIKNPVSVAREVMTKTPHVALIAEGANTFAKNMGFKFVPENQLRTPKTMQKCLENHAKLIEQNIIKTDVIKQLEDGLKHQGIQDHLNEILNNSDYQETRKQYLSKNREIFAEAKNKHQHQSSEPIDQQEACSLDKPVQMSSKPETGYDIEDITEGDTVGAIALDMKGNVAVASSTGGRVGKMPGRMGDTPQIGCGSLADNEIGAVTVTGHGEALAKGCASKHISMLIDRGLSVKEACSETLSYIQRRIGGKGGGVIALDKNGHYAIDMNTRGMAWACIKGDTVKYGIHQGDEFTINLQDILPIQKY